MHRVRTVHDLLHGWGTSGYHDEFAAPPGPEREEVRGLSSLQACMSAGRDSVGEKAYSEVRKAVSHTHESKKTILQPERGLLRAGIAVSGRVGIGREIFYT